MIGALHAAGAGRAADYNLKRRREEADLSQASLSTMMLANQSLVASNEWGEARRAHNYVARLHPAKYIKCDPLMKELFFPILSSKWQFGYTSVSRAISGLTASDFQSAPSNPFIPENDADWAKARGPYRGLVAFTIRSNRIDNPLDQNRKLHARPASVGQSNIGMGTASSAANNNVFSAYRRFTNGPGSSDPGSGGLISQDDCPVFTANPTDNSTQVKNLECGFRADLESKAVQSVNFQHAIGSATSSEGTTTVVANTGGTNANWTGSGRVITTSGNDRRYFQNLRDTTMRIADGYLEMDITNGKSASCLVEVVIHSYKKNANYTAENNSTDESNTRDLYQAIWQAVNYQQRDVAINTSETIVGVPPGGWQALYDPKYPLLAMKSKHKKAANDIANEVHRSSHVLSPGQSKLIKIALGSLYYNLGSQSENAYNTSNNTTNYAGSFDCSAMPVGALQVTIGHSGFEQLTAPANNGVKFVNDPDSYSGSSLAHNLPGTGFWVGKQHAPSEIVARGTYAEKFYPAYVISKERTIAHASVAPPTINLTHDGTQYSCLLPGARPVQDVVGTVNAEDGGVPANNTDPARMDL